MRSRGRPSKFTPEACETILKALSVGTPFDLATAAAGVSYASFRRWMNRGERESKGAYREFFDAVEESRGKAAVKWLAVVEKAAINGDWKAACWRLEHAFPEHFGRTRIDLQTTGKVEHQVESNVQVDLTALSNEELVVLERILEQKQAAPGDA